MQDPFLRVSRIVENGEPIPIFKTEVVKNNLNPIWRPVSLKMQQFVSKASTLSSLFNQMHVAFLNLCVYLHQLSTILLLAKLFASNLKSATFDFYFLVFRLKIIRKIIKHDHHHYPFMIIFYSRP